MYSYWYIAFLYANCLCLLFQHGNFAESKTMTKMKAITSKLQQLHKLQQYKRIDTCTHRNTFYIFIYINRESIFNLIYAGGDYLALYDSSQKENGSINLTPKAMVTVREEINSN